MFKKAKEVLKFFGSSKELSKADKKYKEEIDTSSVLTRARDILGTPLRVMETERILRKRKKKNG